MPEKIILLTDRVIVARRKRLEKIKKRSQFICSLFLNFKIYIVMLGQKVSGVKRLKLVSVKFKFVRALVLVRQSHVITTHFVRNVNTFAYQYIRIQH